MTPPCPAPAGMRWAVLPADGDIPAAHALVSAAGLRLVAARDGDGWTLYGPQGTIIRDGVTAARLPAAILALVSPSPTE